MILMQVKRAVLRPVHSDGQSPPQSRLLAFTERGCKMGKSKNSELQSPKNKAVEGNSEGFSNKIKFPLWFYPKTMEEVNYRFESDNCGSRSEFIEKAINF